MNFAQAMTREGSKTLTENGAVAYTTAGQGALLDLYSKVGALRPRTPAEIMAMFKSAFAEDKLLATKMMFYAGDIRQGGLGERRTFKLMLHWLATNHPDVVLKNLELIPYYNRFDSLFVLKNTKCEAAMWELVAKTLTEDTRAMKASTSKKMVPASLLAKWMPSENASSKETRKAARYAMHKLGLTERKYRKMLSALRKHINVVETKMSAGEWGNIDYTQVPSYAMHNYGSAFAKHDYERFNAFINRAQKGEVKINAGVLYPYDLVGKYMTSRGYLWGDCSVGPEDKVVEAQWKALPNYITEPMNVVVMADVSGSMMCSNGRPMATSIGLATYLATHNIGSYRNKYMTFTDKPHFITLEEGASLRENVEKVMHTDVGYSTNLEAAFNEILRTAVFNHVPNEEMPRALVVISDMEIDPYFQGRRRLDFIETMKAKFKAHGYSCPKIILWNVESRKDTVLTQDPYVILVSGQSASVFKQLVSVLNDSVKTAYDLMLKTLNGKAYEKVRV